jgi:hypothetical protein
LVIARFYPFSLKHENTPFLASTSIFFSGCGPFQAASTDSSKGEKGLAGPNGSRILRPGRVVQFDFGDFHLYALDFSHL